MDLGLVFSREDKTSIFASLVLGSKEIRIKMSCENFEVSPLKAWTTIEEGARFQSDGWPEKEVGS